MNMQVGSVALFFTKVFEVCERHNLRIDESLLAFTDFALKKAISGDWNVCALELRDKLASTLGHMLTANHLFEERPYVRKFELPNGKTLNVVVLNQQSKEWYGSDHSVGAFDFLLEEQRGLFRDCYSFLDLGGHQLVWATYYAMTNSHATTKSFEPSVLNAIIGLFNCLINGVIDRVDVVPFAVSIATSNSENDDSEKMLVDFMNVPLKTCHLGDFTDSIYDFVKTDIEGYEYELLGDETFVQVIKRSKGAHFELHLGHLIRRGVTLKDCVRALKNADLNGIELYSQIEMYDFLQSCDRNGFHSFLVS